MIGTVGKGETVKKIVKLPDRLVEEIDKHAIGFYTSRSEFVSEAIRNLTRKRLREDRDYAEKIMEDGADYLAMSDLFFKNSQEKFFELVRDTDTYKSASNTPVTVYIPTIEMEYIENYIGRRMAVRNLQEYARLASAISIQSLKKEMEIAFEFSIENIDDRPVMTVTWKD